MPRTIIQNIVIAQYKDQTFFEFFHHTTMRFFEIVYFEKGIGIIKINGKTVAYSPKSFFVFIPDDIYVVNAESSTTTVVINFLKSFFKNTNAQNKNFPVNNWFRKIEEILNSESHELREMHFETLADRSHLVSLINMVATEYLNKPYNSLIIEELLANTKKVIYSELIRS